MRQTHAHSVLIEILEQMYPRTSRLSCGGAEIRLWRDGSSRGIRGRRSYGAIRLGIPEDTHGRRAWRSVLICWMQKHLGDEREEGVRSRMLSGYGRTLVHVADGLQETGNARNWSNNRPSNNLSGRGRCSR